MKNPILILIFIFSISLFSCSKDDDDKVCLNCQVEGETFDQLCEGMTDPDSGQTITKDLLEASKALLEAFGASCTLK